MIEIKPISFSEIKNLWQEKLWPNRQSEIEAISWINHEGKIDMSLSIGEPQFWAAYSRGSQIVGVCSGFRTSQERYRSRGLWVDPNYREQGVGRKLIEKIFSVAKNENCNVLWTMPRESSWPFYKKIGFSETYRTDEYEFGPHILAEVKIDNIKIVSEKISAGLDIQKLWASIEPLLHKYPAVMRSAAIGGWALQSTNGHYQDGWDTQFCPYNGPGNVGPTWTPRTDDEKILRPVQDYTRPTELCTTEFQKLLFNLEKQGLHPRKARIIKLMPGHSSVWHQDGSKNFYQVRLHIPLITNADCFFENKNGRYHMAADGSYYFVHINNQHRVANFGQSERYHFVTHVWDQNHITKLHQYNPHQNLAETTHPNVSI